MKTATRTQEPPVVRILAGVAGRSLAVMAGMTCGTVEALTARQTELGPSTAPLQPIVLGVSGGAVAAAAVAVRMSRDQARQIAIDHPPEQIFGKRSVRSLLTDRALYPAARIRELAHAVVGDRTFADFAIAPGLREQPSPSVTSTLIVPVYSATHGTLLLPRDLPKLGLTDIPVADALVAATRVPGALPAAPGLEDIFDGGCEHRVPHDVFAPHPALILDLYAPKPYDSRGGLLFPLLHPSLPVVPHRPRPFHDRNLHASTIFAGLSYGSALRAPTRGPGELFDQGYEIAARWIQTRTADQLLCIVEGDGRRVYR